MASNHNNFMLSSLAKINTNLDFLSTLTISCDDGQFMVNALCWASISEVFAAMLQNQMKEAATFIIKLPQCSTIAMKQLYLALFTGSSLSIEYLPEYIHFAHRYKAKMILDSCIAAVLKLPPYQCFFTYDSQFDLGIYNQLLTNFLKINSYNILSFNEYDLDGDTLPVYNDKKIYLDLWARAKADLFNQKAVTNIIISYLSSNINDVDIFNTNVNELKSIINDKTRVLPIKIDNDDGFNEVKDLTLKRLIIDSIATIINKLKKEAIEQLLQPRDCLSRQSYDIIEDFILQWTYNTKTNKAAKTQNNVKLFVLHEQQKQPYVEQTIIKLDYGKNSWEKYNQMICSRKNE